MKKENNIIKFRIFMCLMLMVCIICTLYTDPVMAQKSTNITFSKKLTREEAADLKEPDAVYEDENGIKYQLVNWELEEKMGEEKWIPTEKQVRYLGLEDGEEIPETIYGETKEALHKTESRTINEQWRSDLCLPVTFYSYGADEYQLGDMVISAENDRLLEETAEEGPLILDSLGLSRQAYHITSMVWNGEPFADENGQLCRNAIALGERLLKDVEVIYKGDILQKEPDFYELHAFYKAEEKEEESTVELTARVPIELPAPAPKQGPFWYLIRTGFVITIALGILGLLTGIILFLITKWRRKEEKDHF